LHKVAKKRESASEISYVRVTRNRIILLVLFVKSLDEKGKRGSEKCVSPAQAILFHYSSNLFSEEAFCDLFRFFRLFVYLSFA